jgi:neurofibromin 1
LTITLTAFQTLSCKKAADYAATSKPADTVSATNLTYRTLIFLNIVPLTLFEDAPADTDEYDKFFEDILGPLIACMDTDDERIRYLTSSIARKLMSNGSVFRLQKELDSTPEASRAKFWRSS